MTKIYILTCFFKLQLSKEEKLKRLCDMNNKVNTSEVIKSERFIRRRNVDLLTEFEKDRLETAMELRSKNTEHCCEMVSQTYINRLFAYYKGGNFNIHIWAWFGYFICLGKEIRFYYTPRKLCL